jgi:predicted transcriptional regulator
MADPQKIIFGTASCEDLVQCIMNLGDLELSILKSLMRKGALRSEDLAKEHKRDKSIIHRALQRLMSCGLVYREKKTITKGGYFYVYTPIEKEQIRSKMMECVDRMYKNMSKLVDEFDIDLKGKK